MQACRVIDLECGSAAVGPGADRALARHLSRAASAPDFRGARRDGDAARLRSGASAMRRTSSRRRKRATARSPRSHFPVASATARISPAPSPHGCACRRLNGASGRFSSEGDLLRPLQPLDRALRNSRERGDAKDQDRRARRVRLYGRRPRPPRRAAPEHRDRRADRQHACRQGDGGGVSALLHARPAEAGRMGEGRLDGARRRLLRAAARHDAGDHRGGARSQSEGEGHRHVGGFPPARHGDLRGMVRPRASRAEAAGRGGLRADRGLSRQDPVGAARRLSRAAIRRRRCSRSCRSPRPG